MKAIKILLLLVLVLFGGAAAALYILPNHIDWNAYKPQIEAFLKKNSGYTINIKGDIRIKTMPEATVDLGGIIVRPFHGDQNILETGPISLQMDLKNLLFMRVILNRISIENPTANLIRDAEGIANWEPKTKKTRPSAPPMDLGPLKALGDVVVSNINFTFSDAKAGLTHKLENVQLSADGHRMSNMSYNMHGKVNAQPFKLRGTLSVSLLQEVPFSLDMTVDDSTLMARGVVLDPFNPPTMSINFNTFELKAPHAFDTLIKLGALKTKPDVIVGEIELKTKMQIEPKRTQLTEMLLVMNNSRFVGDAAYETTARGSGVRANLKINELDINRFFPKSEKPKAKRAGPPWNDTLIDTSFLRRLQLRLGLEITQLKGVIDPTLENVEVKLTADNGTALLDTLYFRLGKGEFRGSGRVDTGSPSRYQLRGKYSNLPLEMLMSSDKAQYIELPMSGEMEFLFSGNTSKEIVENLNGKMSVAAPQGNIKGVNIADPAIALTNFLAGKKVLDRIEPYTNFSATFEVANGVIRNDDLSLEAINMVFKGRGRVDLSKWTINYSINPITRSSSLANIVLGVRIQGGLDGPLAVPIMDNKTTGAAIGTALGGPVGAGVGALIGTVLDNAGKKDDAPTPQPGQSGTVNLPFDFSDVNKLEENVRRFLDQGKQ